jgi:hypothetical protein
MAVLVRTFGTRHHLRHGGSTFERIMASGPDLIQF